MQNPFKIATGKRILCMKYFNNTIYFGNSRGEIFKIKLSENIDFSTNNFIIEKIANFYNPISSIVINNNNIFCSTWKGEIFNVLTGKFIILKNNIIKTMEISNDEILAGIDKTLFILDFDLKIKKEIIVKTKIQCMNKVNNSILIGQSLGIVGIYNKEYSEFEKISERGNIISIKSIENDIITGTTENILRKNKNILFEGDEWINAIFNENLFAVGNDIIKNNKILYSHIDKISEILENEKYIISSGIDGNIMIYLK